VFVRGKPFQPNVCGKAEACPSEAPIRCFTLE
jgi:hypothetical protein